MTTIINASSSAGLVQTADTSAILQLQTGSTAAVTIDASQNVGIGTSSPSGLGGKVLQIDSASNYPEIISNRTGTGAGKWGTLVSNSGGYLVRDYTASTNPFFIEQTTGNVGIGSTAPTTLLTVNKTQNSETSITVKNPQTGTAAKAIIRFGNDNGDNVGSVGALSSTYTPSGALEADGFYVDAARQSLNLSASNSGVIKFFGTGTERMRIGSGGQVSVNTNTHTTGFGGQFTSLSTTATGAWNAIQALSACGSYPLVVANTNGSSGSLVYFGYNGNNVGTISTNGTTTSYNTSSDYRLKENIAPMTGALATVSALKPVTYKWKSDGSNGQGFIAHELQAIVPDCVTGEKDAVKNVNEYDEEVNVIGTNEVPDYQGIDSSFLVATLTAAIQEQQALITDLTTRLAALEGAK